MPPTHARMPRESGGDPRRMICGVHGLKSGSIDRSLPRSLPFYFLRFGAFDTIQVLVCTMPSVQTPPPPSRNFQVLEAAREQRRPNERAHPGLWQRAVDRIRSLKGRLRCLHGHVRDIIYFGFGVSGRKYQSVCLRLEPFWTRGEGRVLPR